MDENPVWLGDNELVSLYEEVNKTPRDARRIRVEGVLRERCRRRGAVGTGPIYYRWDKGAGDMVRRTNDRFRRRAVPSGPRVYRELPRRKGEAKLAQGE